jgi:hypothetical protein
MHEKLKLHKKFLKENFQGTDHLEDLKTLLTELYIYSFKSNGLEEHIFRQKCFFFQIFFLLFTWKR